jgi:hypothetical protein
MKIGVSGHRHRDSADWLWVGERIKELIVGMRSMEGYTSLAPGADQIFADMLLAEQRRLVAVVPICGGRVELEEEDREGFDRLIEHASRVIKVKGATRDDAFLRAGKRVVNLVDFMIFVWDGEPARGIGGTADIVSYAAKRRRRGVILDPIERTMRLLEPR